MTTVEQWRPREERDGEDFTIYLRPRRNTLVDREKIVDDITQEQERMKEYDEKHIEFLWRCRNSISKSFNAFKWRQVLWTELERRYEGVLRKPIEISIPYLERMDGIKIRDYVKQKIDEQPWPWFLKEWHKQKFRVTTSGGRTIADILTNVTKPSWIKTGCRCQELRKICPQSARVEGHVLMTGRDFEGEDFKAMRVCAANVPRQTWADVFRTWESVGRQLPPGWREEDENVWKRQLFSCTRKPKDYQRGWLAREIPSTKEVYQVRKQLTGMVTGPLDKNNGELWVCCPMLYHRALRKAYGEGYERIYPAKLSQYRKQRYGVDELPKQILRPAPAPKKQQGGEKDVKELYARIYRKRGWGQYAKFNNQGGLNQPYVLFKAKNVVDHATRRVKWMKVRPIAPGTKHPMRRLMHYVGRAWSFVTARIPGEHLVINKTSQVPAFLEEAKQVARHGQMKMAIFDIEGCYPNMPKETIRFALRDVLKQMETKYGYDGVWVPKWSDTRPCGWKKGKGFNMQKIPFEVMLDVMEFSLDFALIRMPNGQILRQTGGIPMGDPFRRE